MIKQSYDDGKNHIHVLSYGGGTQSTALLLMALNGEINGVVPDFIIHADTGNEPKNVYEFMDKVNDHIKSKYNREIIFTNNGNIYDDIIHACETGERAASLPYHTVNPQSMIEAMGRRQCTGDYKITPVNRKVRELLGYTKGQRVKEVVHMWKGISTDEIQRVKPIPDKWIEAEHPLIDIADVDRSRCIGYVERQGLGTPPKSSCIICPFHNNQAWLEIKKNDPEGFQKACELDEMIREKLKYRDDLYLHKSRIPLKDVDLQENQMTIDEFTSECEGFCGI